MSTFLLTLGLVSASLPQINDNDRVCHRRTICTMEYRPTSCHVKDQEELNGTGSNRCRAMASLRYQLCAQEITVEPEDIVCKPLNTVEL